MRNRHVYLIRQRLRLHQRLRLRRRGGPGGVCA